MKIFFKTFLISFFFFLGFSQSFAGLDIIQGGGTNSVQTISGSYISAYYSGATTFEFVDTDTWTIFETRNCSDMEIQYLDNNTMNYVCGGTLVVNTPLYLFISNSSGNVSPSNFVFTSSIVTESGTTNSGSNSNLYLENTQTGSHFHLGYQDNYGDYYLDKSAFFTILCWFWFLFFSTLVFLYLLLKLIKIGYNIGKK